MFCPISRRNSPSMVNPSASERIFCSSSLVSSLPFLCVGIPATFRISRARVGPMPKISGREYASCLLSGMVTPEIRIRSYINPGGALRRGFFLLIRYKRPPRRTSWSPGCCIFIDARTFIVKMLELVMLIDARFSRDRRTGRAPYPPDRP